MSTDVPTAQLHTLIWAFSESPLEKYTQEADSFVAMKVPRGVPEHTSIYALTCTPQAPHTPQLLADHPPRVLRFIVLHKKQLDAATDTFIEHLRPIVDEVKTASPRARLGVLCVPFWYKIVIATALTELQAWDVTTMPECARGETAFAVAALGPRLCALPTGLLVGPTISAGARGKPPHDNRRYMVMPRRYQYLNAKQPHVRLLTPDMESSYGMLAARTQSTNWASFRDDEEGGDL